MLLSLPREMSQLIVLDLSSNLPLVRSFYSERNWYCFNMCVFALRHAAVRPRFAIEFGMTVYQTFYVFPIFRVWTLSRSSGTSRFRPFLNQFPSPVHNGFLHAARYFCGAHVCGTSLNYIPRLKKVVDPGNQRLEKLFSAN